MSVYKVSFISKYGTRVVRVQAARQAVGVYGDLGPIRSPLDTARHPWRRAVTRQAQRLYPV